jgi:hypothetical protein
MTHHRYAGTLIDPRLVFAAKEAEWLVESSFLQLLR